MVRHLSAAAIVTCMLLLGACSGGGDANDASTVSPTAVAAPPARTPTVIDDQLEALEKAKAVQATLDAAEAERRRKLDEAGG
jgi:hypothetical protein